MMTTVSTRPYVPARRVTVDGITYDVAEGRSVVDIDRDLAWQNGQWANDSWFVVSNLDSGGQRIGFQVHLLIMYLPAGGAVVSLNAGVVNETARLSRSLEYVYQLDQIEISADRLHISTPQLTLTGDRAGLALTLRGEQAQIDVTTTVSAPAVLMNGQGQMVFIDVNQYEFAFPAMRTTGTVVLDGTTYEVSGSSWLDRQWGDLPSFFTGQHEGEGAFDSMNWIWSNPQLDNGVNMAVAQVRDMRHHKIYFGLTAVHPDGTHVVVTAMEPFEAGDYWTSPVTGRRYPTRWVVRAPQIETELIVEVPFKEQEIVSQVGGVTKFEGMATITGFYQGQRISGYSYLELVGNWS